MTILEIILSILITVYLVMDGIQFRQIKELLEIQEMRIDFLNRRIELLKEEINVWKDKRLR